MPIKSVPQYAVIDHATLGDNTLVAAVAGKKIRVLAVWVDGSGGANLVRFESGAGGTALTGLVSITATAGYVLPANGFGWFETAPGELLNLELTIALLVSGALVYEEVE